MFLTGDQIRELTGKLRADAQRYLRLFETVLVDGPTMTRTA